MASRDPCERDGHQREPVVSLNRQRLIRPDRSDLPPLEKYARLRMPDGSLRIAGCTEASRGCLRRCRHCPIASVYRGALRIVPREVVLADIRQQVAGGAQHITFADPDFLNAPRHSMTIVRAMQDEWPGLTYDATIRVENLRRHRRLLPDLRTTGCVLVTAAAESFDDDVLARLDKGHTRAEFADAVVTCRRHDLALNATFVPFTPWTTLGGYLDFLCGVLELDLVEEVAPVQYAIRLLIPAQSGLPGIPEVRDRMDAFDEKILAYRWRHTDPRVDRLQNDLFRAACAAQRLGLSRCQAFAQVWRLAERSTRAPSPVRPARRGADPTTARAAVPYLTEPWYC